jgi:single-strand DNA-binding protein
MSLNKVQIIGNLGDDVKLHRFDDNNCIGKFPLATNEIYTNKQGEKVKQTEWHNIVVRNKQAETLEKYLKKGDQIYVEGKIKTRKWQDDKGNDRYSTEIHVFNFTFLSNNTNSESKSNKVGDDFLNMVNSPKDENDLPF